MGDDILRNDASYREDKNRLGHPMQSYFQYPIEIARKPFRVVVYLLNSS